MITHTQTDYRNLLYFRSKFFRKTLNDENETCLHSCGLYAMGLVKTKIEHFFIEIFADEN